MMGTGVKPSRPVRVDLGDDSLRVLWQIREETGLTYQSILLRALMLYRAFLRAGKEEKPDTKASATSGPLGDTIEGVVRKLKAKQKKGGTR